MYIRYVLDIKICPNQHTDLARFLFTENFLKIKESGPSFQVTFFFKKCNIT